VSKVEDVSEMPDKKPEKKLEKKIEKKPSGKKPSFIKKLLGGLQRVFVLSFKNMAAELKKVSWPNRKDLTNYSIVVISFMLLMAVLIGLLDLGTSSLLRIFINKG